MSDRLDIAADPDAVAAERDAVVSRIRDHAGEIAYAIARIEGGDYGRRSFKTDDGEWTVKHEQGDIEFLLFEPRSGQETYVVSTQQPPEPAALAEALADYDAFVAAFDDYVRSLDGLLDDVPTEFPTPASAADVVAERDRIVARLREVCNQMAGELYRYEMDDYGTFTARVNGTRWELKREESSTSYLRAGGSGGTYLLSQYGPPSAEAVREFAPDAPDFVAAYNDHVAELELDLEQIDL
ncbi:hypothetical protein DM867_06115 [Halosegnis rubeus]|jgi:hypothetical protein|uniref:Profilin fold domain-containing protein n=1 Tax=Halosegnis rubeus TaxID=2212850 RepID=A0A5N5UGY8_9EURY|nr:hypothetical protein [Halosegnis rubeus]KAB7514688.1 hypothetical protein DM867_06115 [Halosegnis rubeus]KAB7517997.1 hypothetical protein DMP03_01125 [Halosegnis rubeus]